MFTLRKSLKLMRCLPVSPIQKISCTEMNTGGRLILISEFSDYQERNLYKTGQHSLDKSHRLVHTASKTIDFKNFGGQLVGLLTEVKMKELSEAPGPFFWLGAAGLVPLVGTPLAHLVIGYSPALASLQLSFAATILAFLGGVKWGYAIPPESPHKPTWENMGWAIVPQCVATLGLVAPQALGYLMVASGLTVAAVVDLTSAAYPPWFRALRVALTTPAVLALLLSFIMCLFHGSPKSQKTP